MSIHVTLNCPHCGAEIECEVVINEECDLPETCPACGNLLPEFMYSKAEEAAIAKATEAPDDD